MSDNPLQDWHGRDREFASHEALRLAGARDDLTNRYRLGLATFNAASIVALLTAVAGAPEAVETLGFNGETVKLSLACFAIGVLAAGTSISSTQNHLIERAGYANARVSVIDRLIMASDYQRLDDGTYGQAQKESQKLFEKGLKDRFVARWAQNIAVGAWIGGVTVPLLTMFGVVF